ncbi:hypothetical protein H5410_048034 [Solanum commersonii]|uniref:Uncharacterized protein n=1 Tax=Solanum commersonii TaxID=4109 RepID=A0A9J5XKQ8_SOLCO|nr:hypothetical protein H5410_048034 [Solanum commersonii]
MNEEEHTRCIKSLKEECAKLPKAAITEDNDNHGFAKRSSGLSLGALLQTDLNEICGYTSGTLIGEARYSNEKLLAIKLIILEVSGLIFNKLPSNPQYEEIEYIKGNDNFLAISFQEASIWTIGRKSISGIHIDSNSNHEGNINRQSGGRCPLCAVPQKTSQRILRSGIPKPDLKELSQLPSKLLSGKITPESSGVLRIFSILWNAKILEAYYPRLIILRLKKIKDFNVKALWSRQKLPSNKNGSKPGEL